MRRIRVAAPLAALALALAACGSGSSGGPGSVGPGSVGGASSSDIAGLPANNHGSADVTGKTTVSIEADSYYFAPSVLKGTPGQQLTLHVVNATGTAHNITVDAQHINTDLDAHKSVDTTVTMPATGVLSFWCEYHKSRGMVGGLLVSGSVAGNGPAATPSSSDSGGGYGGYGNG